VGKERRVVVKNGGVVNERNCTRECVGKGCGDLVTSANDSAANRGSDSRLPQLVAVVMRLAAGEYEARAEDSGRGDDLDALAVGINMLIEEVVAKFGENDKLVRFLGESVEILRRQQQTIEVLSTPSLMVWKGIIVLPIIGVLDNERVLRFSKELLTRVAQEAVDVVILDVTGLAVMDTQTVRLLVDIVGALRLLGARSILTGLRAQAARLLVEFDLDFGTLATRASLYEGLKLALAMTGREVTRMQTRRGV